MEPWSHTSRIETPDVDDIAIVRTGSANYSRAHCRAASGRLDDDRADRASQTILTYLATGGEVRIRPVILLSLALWYWWAVLSPVIWWAARRLPLHGSGWPLRALAPTTLPSVGLGALWGRFTALFAAKTPRASRRRMSVAG